MADIAINPVDRRVQFTGNTGTGPFAFTFNILADEDIVVYKNTTLLSLTTDYTVSTNVDGTGSVTLVAAVVSSDVLTIIGGRSLERTTDFVTAGDLLAVSLNEQLDSLVIMSQQLDEKMTRSFKVNPGDQFTDLEMPLLDDRKGKFLQFNSTTGDPEAGPSNTAISSIADFTDEINTVGDDLASGSYVAGGEYDFGSITDDSLGSTGSPDGFIVTVFNNLASITNVASIGANVTTVASISADVTTAATNNANITTVAGDISNVNTVAGISGNVTTVAGISADVTAVAADATDIGTVAGLDTEIGALGPIASDITGANAISANITTVAGISADVTSVAGISANVTTVAGLSSDIAAVVADEADIGTVAANISNVAALGPISADVTTAAGNTANITTVATNDANITTVAGVSANVTTVAGVSSDVTTVAGISADVTTVAGDSADIQTVATNLSSINDFADKYRIGATDPTSDNDEGDLFYNTTSDTLKVYDGVGWQAGVTAGSGFLALTGGTMTGALATTSTIDGRDVAADGTKLDGIEASATADQTPAEILTAIKTVDGASSGLDADLLDGEEGSYYLDAANLTGTLPAIDGSALTGLATYTAGSGLDLTGSAFSVESDLRGDVTQIGADTNDYYVVGTTTHKWYLDGNEDMRLENDGDLHVDGNVVAYSTTVSDERLKTDIVKIDSALDKVDQISGYTFTYTADGKKSAGVIAQEVEKILPSAITESTLPLKTGDDETEYKTVQYDQLIGLLVEAVKELKAEVAELKGN